MEEKLKLSQAVIVEGRYDKIKLSNIIDISIDALKELSSKIIDSSLVVKHVSFKSLIISFIQKFLYDSFGFKSFILGAFRID